MRAEEGGRRKKLRETFDVVTARAVKSLPVVAEWALPFVKEGGVFLAMKGPGAEEELAAAEKILALMHTEAEEKKRSASPPGKNGRSSSSGSAAPRRRPSPGKWAWRKISDPVSGEIKNRPQAEYWQRAAVRAIIQA